MACARASSGAQLLGALSAFCTTSEPRMAWETRQRGGSYYRRYRREAGRVVREYVGMGERANHLAAEDEVRRQQVEAERAAARTLADDIETLSELAELLAHA